MELKDLILKLKPETAIRLENVSDEEYFGPNYKDYVSNSLLSLINPEQSGSPLKFLDGFKKPSNSSALELGSAVHQLLLEPDKHILSEVNKPTGKVGDIMDSIYNKMSVGVDFDTALQQSIVENDYYNGNPTKARVNTMIEQGADYLQYLQTKNDTTEKQICLKADDVTRLKGCLNSINENKLISETLFPSDAGMKSYNEDVLVMDYSVETFMDEDFKTQSYEGKLKCKIDNWSIDFANKIVTLNDLKTTSAPVDQFGGYYFEKMMPDGSINHLFNKGSFQKFHYHRQMAMYSYMLWSYLNNAYGDVIDDTWTFHVNMAVVGTQEPYTSLMFRVSDEWLNTGRFEFENLLKRLAYHHMFGFDNFININKDEVIII